MKAKLEQNLRVYSGLFIAFFLVLHLLNASLGLLSLAVMDKLGSILFAFWSIPIFTAMLYGAFVVHVALTLLSLYRRRSLSMPFWSFFQIVMGITMPLLLVSHILGTRGVDIVLDVQRNYSHLVTGLWGNLERTIQQFALVLIAWTHMSMGIHFWLRHKSGYRNWLPILYPLCLFIPLLAMLGFTRAGIESKQTNVKSEAFNRASDALQQADPALREYLRTLDDQILLGLGIILFAILLIHLIRRYVGLVKGGFQIFHTGFGKPIKARRGQSVLEALREAKLPHAAVCGGRGRCTTCRVRVGNGLFDLQAPNTLESNALKRVSADPSVRLACQIRPSKSVTITPLIQPNNATQTDKLHSGVIGHEQKVVCMFVDMRRSTELGEQKLPFDVIFIVNQFFIQLSQALRTTNGHYASFNGDGLMALYGLNSDLKSGCRDALKGAVEIQRRIETLNDWLSDELDLPLQFGIGIHCGEAIVGTMGPPETPVLNAIGNTINISARLEALTKKYEAQLVVSEAVLQEANIDYSAFPNHIEQVKGSGESVSIIVIEQPSLLSVSMLQEVDDEVSDIVQSG